VLIKQRPTGPPTITGGSGHARREPERGPARGAWCDVESVCRWRSKS